MKNARKTGGLVPIEFSPEIQFNLAPHATFRQAQQSRFERLKERLLVEKLDELVDPGLNSALRQAANEAAAVAWVTQFPLLVFPALFEEKTGETLLRGEKQQEITQRSRELLAV